MNTIHESKSFISFNPDNYGLQRLRNAAFKTGRENSRLFPWRIHSDPYFVFVSEFFLQRTQASQVVRVFENFIEKFPNLPSATSATNGDLNSLLNPLGLYHRINAFKTALFQLKKNFNSKIPNSENELLSLFGVGKYLARTVLCFGFKKRVGVVDPNVARVIVRYFGLSEIPSRPHTSNKFWEISEKIVSHSKRDPRFLNWGLIDLGRELCKKNKPRCENCYLTKTCQKVLED